MADKYSPVEIVLDANTRSRRVIVGSSLEIPDENQQINLFDGSQHLFMAKVFKGNPSTPYVFTAGTSFIWGADNEYNHTPNPVSSLNTQFHNPGDWNFDPAVGMLCWRANLATAELFALMISTTTQPLILHSCLWAFPPAIDAVLIAAWDLSVWLPGANAATATAVKGYTHLTTQQAASLYVPIWGDQAYERRKNGRTQVLFPDGKWRSRIGVIVDGKPDETWGDPED